MNTIEPDTASVMLTKIIELDSNIVVHELYLQLAVIVLVMVVALDVMQYVAWKRSQKRWDDLSWITSIVTFMALVIVLLLALGNYYDGIYLDNLISGYEWAYGPIPEGLLESR